MQEIAKNLSKKKKMRFTCIRALNAKERHDYLTVHVREWIYKYICSYNYNQGHTQKETRTLHKFFFLFI